MQTKTMDKYPKFFRASDDLRDLKVYPWIEEVVSGRKCLPMCKTCRKVRVVHSGDLVISLMRGRGVKWPDWLGGAVGPPIIFSERVLDAWQKEGIGEFPHNKVTIQSPVFGLLKNKKQPEYFWIDNGAISGARLDLEASCKVNAKYCADCSLLGSDFIASLDLQKNQKCPWVFIEGSWNGAKFFSADREIFCTEEVVRCAAKYKFTNFRFIPIEEGQGLDVKGIDYMKMYAGP